MTCINEYINNNCIITEDYQKTLYILEELQLFFINNEITITLDIADKLLKSNQILYTLISEIVTKNYTTILDGDVEILFDDENTLTLIESYCNINNIIKKEEIIIDNYSQNLVKQYFRTLNSLNPLTKEEQLQLIKKIKNGDNEAREKLIESNLKLVVSIAKKYLHKGLDFMDLIQEGNYGILQAIENYDLSYDVKFSTYAVYWIKFSIYNSLVETGRTIRIPSYLYNKVIKYITIENQLKQELERTVSVEEVAERMNISKEKALEYEKLKTDVISLNTIIDTKEDKQLQDTIKSIQNDVEDKIFIENMQTEVRKIYENCGLNDIEKAVLALRYYKTNENIITLKEISKKYNISRERIRQIEWNALKKIRKFQLTNRLTDFTYNPSENLKKLYKWREFYLNYPNSYKFIEEDIESKKKVKK